MGTRERKWLGFSFGAARGLERPYALYPPLRAYPGQSPDRAGRCRTGAGEDSHFMYFEILAGIATTRRPAVRGQKKLGRLLPPRAFFSHFF